MGEDEGEVVFLDDEDVDEQEWLAEERVERGQDPGVLPPLASRNRLLASLVALALFVSGVGTAFTAAYHRHMADLQIANLLELTAAAYPPQIPNLPTLAFASTWHAKVQEQVLVPVVNRSPKPIVLLGAILQEPGMVGAANLAPTGVTTLKSGATGTVAGLVTVNCAQGPPLGYPAAGGDPSFVIPVQPSASLRVRAKTFGGEIAEATLDPEEGQADEAEMQERICLQQGSNAVTFQSDSFRYDAAAHLVTFDWTVKSNADAAVQYKDSVTISAPGRDATAPCTAKSARPTTPATGTIQPGATLAMSFAIQMSACPAGSTPPSTEAVMLSIYVSIHGDPLTADTMSLPVGLS